MDGVHDLGGVQGFGAVRVDPDEPVFAAEWERRVFGLNFAALPAGVDEFRSAVERMGAVDYLVTPYYEHWLAALETLAVETGTATPGELARRRAEAAAGGAPPRRVDPDRAARLRAALRTPHGPPEPAGASAFGPGARVVVRRHAPRRHTRCPRYVRGAPGVVAAVRGLARLPDESAEGRVVTEPLYSVEFRARDLWGEGSHTVALDLWESYLTPAPQGGEGAGDE